MSQKLSIKIKIADREYPMQIEQGMESKLRTAGKKLNDKIKTYSKQLGVQDRQDLLAMAAFDCIVEWLTLEENTQKSNGLLLNKVSNLDDLVSSAL